MGQGINGFRTLCYECKGHGVVDKGVVIEDFFVCDICGGTGIMVQTTSDNLDLYDRTEG